MTQQVGLIIVMLLIFYISGSMPKPKPVNTAFDGMMFLSFLALLLDIFNEVPSLGSVCLALIGVNVATIYFWWKYH